MVSKAAPELEKVEIDRPSTWLKFNSTMCAGCWSGCCTLPVEVSVMDLIRLGVATEDEAAVSLKKVAKRLVREGVVQRFFSKSQIFILQQRNGRDCIYLDQNRRCTVYEKRPQVCRSFPKIGPRPGFCPKQKVDRERLTE